MRRQTIEAILEHLSNGARNSAHTIFGAVDLIRCTAPGDERLEPLQRGLESTERLLRTIDDLRELLSTHAWTPAPPDLFDLTICIGQIVEGLNLASIRRARSVVMAAPDELLMLNQDAISIEHGVLRLLDTTCKLSASSEVRLSLARIPQKEAVRLTISPRDLAMTQKLVGWLNSDATSLELQEPGEVPFAAAVMVAGRRFRALNASSEIAIDKAGHGSLAIEIPPYVGANHELAIPSAHMDRNWRQALNVLLVEDHDESFVLSELLFGQENVSRARDGLEAVQVVKRRRFDIIFMDIHMPGLDGYTAIREIREWETRTGNAHTPVVILSSDDIDLQRRKAAQSGCSGFLRKPLRQSDLISVLSRLRQSRCLAV
jgi:CheY-like chemotaxis protein